MKKHEDMTEAEKRAACEAAVKLMESPTWPYVLKFAERMEAKLAKNRHKGDREGWLKDNPWNLVERILDETVELQQCFSTDGAGAGVWLLKTPEETADECADVANFCMMVADRVKFQPSMDDKTQTTPILLRSNPRYVSDCCGASSEHQAVMRAGICTHCYKHCKYVDERGSE